MKTIIHETKGNEKCESDLLKSSDELILQIAEKEKCLTDLTINNKALFLQIEQNGKHAAALIAANRDLNKLKDDQTKHIHELEEMMFIVSHKVRQPVANILGISNLFDTVVNSADDFKKMSGLMKQSAEALDDFTRELSDFIHEMKNKKQDM